MASNIGTVNVNLALGRCRNCRWWAAPAASLQGECLHKKVANGLDQADGIGDSYGDGTMLTGPDFGCIHYEGKP